MDQVDAKLDVMIFSRHDRTNVRALGTSLSEGSDFNTGPNTGPCKTNKTNRANNRNTNNRRKTFGVVAGDKRPLAGSSYASAANQRRRHSTGAPNPNPYSNPNPNPNPVKGSEKDEIGRTHSPSYVCTKDEQNKEEEEEDDSTAGRQGGRKRSYGRFVSPQQSTATTTTTTTTGTSPASASFTTVKSDSTSPGSGLVSFSLPLTTDCSNIAALAQQRAPALDTSVSVSASTTTTIPILATAPAPAPATMEEKEELKKYIEFTEEEEISRYCALQQNKSRFSCAYPRSSTAEGCERFTVRGATLSFYSFRPSLSLEHIHDNHDGKDKDKGKSGDEKDEKGDKGDEGGEDDEDEGRSGDNSTVDDILGSGQGTDVESTNMERCVYVQLYCPYMPSSTSIGSTSSSKTSASTSTSTTTGSRVRVSHICGPMNSMNVMNVQVPLSLLHECLGILPAEVAAMRAQGSNASLLVDVELCTYVDSMKFPHMTPLKFGRDQDKDGGEGLGTGTGTGTGRLGGNNEDKEDKYKDTKDNRNQRNRRNHLQRSQTLGQGFRAVYMRKREVRESVQKLAHALQGR